MSESSVPQANANASGPRNPAGTGTHPTNDLRLITLDPGHFHAALFQREMLPGVAERVSIYAPLGPDLTAHLNRVAQFNLRPDNPTRWKLEVHTGPDFLERMLSERPGDIVVISGRNRGKIDRIEAIVGDRLNVLADKPWIIELADLPKLGAALELAETKRVAAWDAMTERFEITFILQKALVNDRDIFGEPLKGTVDEPAVHLQSMHYLFKEVAGAPNLRPAWFFDVRQQGEGLTDVGTHLVDIVPWILFPEQAIQATNDIQVPRGTRWPTLLTLEQFKRVTGVGEFPDFLRESVTGNSLRYFCNNTVSYTVRGVHVKLEVNWDFEAPPGVKDNDFAVFHGSTSRVEVRQGREEKYRRQVYVVPNRPEQKAAVLAAVNRRVEALQSDYPGLAVQDGPGGIRLEIPERFRLSHEEHFALVVRRFLEYVREPKLLPVWEKPNMLAKYYVTTLAVHLARQNPTTSYYR
jgi:predicted dehydrogenase